MTCYNECFRVKFSRNKMAWSHYLDNVSPELQADVEVLKC